MFGFSLSELILVSVIAGLVLVSGKVGPLGSLIGGALAPKSPPKRPSDDERIGVRDAEP